MATLGEDLLRFKKDQLFLLPDTETEGVNLFLSRPWSIAWLTATQDEILEKHDHYIYWKDINVSRDAARITGFDRQKYFARAEPAAEILDKFESYLNDPRYLIVGHNFFFDAEMINSWRRALGRPVNWNFLPRMICTNCLAKSHKKGIPFDRTNFLLSLFKFNSYIEKGLKTNLGQMCRDFGIELDESQQHQAGYDIKRGYEVFKKLLWSIEI